MNFLARHQNKLLRIVRRWDPLLVVAGVLVAVAAATGVASERSLWVGGVAIIFGRALTHMRTRLTAQRRTPWLLLWFMREPVIFGNFLTLLGVCLVARSLASVLALLCLAGYRWTWMMPQGNTRRSNFVVTVLTAVAVVVLIAKGVYRE